MYVYLHISTLCPDCITVPYSTHEKHFWWFIHDYYSSLHVEPLICGFQKPPCTVLAHLMLFASSKVNWSTIVPPWGPFRNYSYYTFAFQSPFNQKQIRISFIGQLCYTHTRNLLLVICNSQEWDRVRPVLFKVNKVQTATDNKKNKVESIWKFLDSLLCP